MAIMVKQLGSGRQDGGGHWEGWAPGWWWALGWVGTGMLLGTGMLPGTRVGGYQDNGGYHSRWVPGWMLALGPVGTGTGGHWGEGSRHLTASAGGPGGDAKAAPGKEMHWGTHSPPLPGSGSHPLQPQLPESRYFVTPPAVPSPREQPTPGWRHRAPRHPTVCGHGEEQSCCARPCHELLRQVEASPWPRATRALPLPSRLGWVPAGGLDGSGFCQVTAGRGNLWNQHITWVPDSP